MAGLLVPAGVKAGTLDQSQEGANSNVPGINSVVAQAQTFTAGITGALDRVDLFLSGSGACDVVVQIRTVTGGKPSATVLTSATVPASSIPAGGSPAFVPVLFPTPAPVTNGTRYAIVASTTTAGLCLTLWTVTEGDPYPAGAAFFSQDSGTTWDAHTAGRDFKFRTYVAPAANLALTTTDSPDPATVGQNLVYTLYVSNGGGADAEDVQIVDMLPASVPFVSASAGCTNVSGTVTCVLGTVPSGTSRTVQITVTPTQAGTITNTATVATSSIETQASNNTANEPTTVNAATSSGSPPVMQPSPSPSPTPAPGDRTAPDTSITSNPHGNTRERTPSFNFTSSEQGSTFQCSVDGADFAPCTAPSITSTLDFGRHTFQVRAIDAAGNTDLSPASETFTVKHKHRHKHQG